jgi:uncharacterized protein YndB with AHSA1/START domain
MVATTIRTHDNAQKSTKMITNIHREATYAHPRAKVWRALTEPALMEKWLMKPEGFAARVGTKFKLVAQTPQRGWRGFVECEVLAVEEQSLLRYSWVGDERHPPLTVTFYLTDEGACTKLVLDHTGFEGIGGFLLAKLMLGPGWSKLLKRMILIALAAA